MSTGELGERFARIERTAEESGCFVVTAVLSSECQETHRVSMDFESFLALLKHCRPPVLYAFSDMFDARQALEAWWEIDENDEGDAALMREPRVRLLIRQASRLDGQIGTVLASFFVGSVLHNFYAEADWFSKFEAKADELKQQLVEERQREHDEASKRETAECQRYAKTLCEHPKFIEGRPSREKRIYLAQSLFPSLDRMAVSGIVDEAANMHWLFSK